MPLTDFWMLDRIVARHPPADLIVAGYLGYKPGGKPNRKAALKENMAALSTIPQKMLAASMKTIDQMPEFIRGPEMQKVMEGIKAEWRTS